MTPLIKMPLAIAVTALLVAGAFAQIAVVDVDDEPAPTLTVHPPLAMPLSQGVVFLPYRPEYLRVVPVGESAAQNISPRVGNLHITLAPSTSR